MASVTSVQSSPKVVEIQFLDKTASPFHGSQKEDALRVGSCVGDLTAILMVGTRVADGPLDG